MITQFRLENFKGHRDTDLVLQQLTLLVGDNGSGKTSVLEALRLSDRLATHPEDLALDELLHRDAHHMQLSFDGSTHGELWATSMTLRAPGYNDWGDTWEIRTSGVDKSGQFNGQGPLGSDSSHLRQITRHTGRASLYRFRADQVAASAYSDQPNASVAEDGAQTAVALATLKLADDDAFNRIESAMRRLVPSLKRVFIKPATVKHPSNPNPVTGSKLYFDFQGAKNVPAHHASQGTLVVLALLTVLYSRDRPSVILLDDFDHSLHPRAQIELVRMIKELLALDEFKEMQIIATTHSPYVLDEVSPSNVIAFALREDGTVVSKPLSEHPDAPKVNGTLKAGELWTLDAERDWVR
ncbi:MAG TPA: AAA family ATPase [Kofleriaceae bacterium]